ncbi:MAG: site-specific integrase [Acidobacteria bacterium]|nr:site-specific integrase [Acidobacteriota bacterium]
MRRESKSTTGSVVKDKRSQKWQFFWWADGKRHSKTLGRFPTKTAAWNAAQQFRAELSQPQPSNAPTVADLVDQYREEKMPKRYSTRRSYNAWLRNHVLPKFGTCPISDVQARPAELWLECLSLTPRSRAAVRGLLRILWEYAMWRGDVPTQRNPMELVTIKGASKRTRKPRSLTVDEFQRFSHHLGEPFHTIALVCVCFGLRISEALALKWSDVDWLDGKISVQRGIVRQQVDDVKTETSHKAITVTEIMVEALKRWKQTTQFSAQEDWIFASPSQLGRLPWSADSVNDAYKKAASAAKVEHVSTHSMRHTYRSWLDAVGTPIAVQQKLMRHADIRTTMNTYGDVVTDEMAVACGKVARLALNGTGAARDTR